jgi:HAD superfamily hydrolase (TIGR01509 family)
VRALVFDYDGLIIDSESPAYEAWCRIYAEHGSELTAQEWIRVIGKPDEGSGSWERELERRVGKELPWPAIHERRLKHHQDLMLSKAALPGVERLMRSARQAGWKVGIASASSAAWIEGGLKRMGLLELVQTIRSKDRVTQRKPHPEAYLLALQDLGADAAQSFAFEDSNPGVAAAKAAGLRVIAVPNSLTRLHDLSAADQILDSLELFNLPL